MMKLGIVCEFGCHGRGTSIPALEEDPWTKTLCHSNKVITTLIFSDYDHLQFTNAMQCSRYVVTKHTKKATILVADFLSLSFYQYSKYV